MRNEYAGQISTHDSVCKQVPLGLYIVRGENVVLLGEIDPSRDPPILLTRVPEDVIRRAIKAETEQDKLKAASRFDFLEE